MNPKDIMTDAIHNFHPQYQQYTQYSSGEFCLIFETCTSMSLSFFRAEFASLHEKETLFTDVISHQPYERL